MGEATEYLEEGMRVPLHVFDGGQRVEMDANAIEQGKRLCTLPFVRRAALMPDAHLGKGGAVGTVLVTDKVIIPATVGVDLGCGMCAFSTSLNADDLPDNLGALRSELEAAIPHGRTRRGGFGDTGTWRKRWPREVAAAWDGELHDDYEKLCETTPALKHAQTVNHLGTLGTGNHFVELCLDEHNNVWGMLHSGSRGIGNRIGTHFIRQAQKEMERWHIQLPDADLAYLPAGSEHYQSYIRAVGWAQRFARANRDLMVQAFKRVLREHFPQCNVQYEKLAVNCHHNYIERNADDSPQGWITRKGAIRAAEGVYGVLPSAMGQTSYIVRGKGSAATINSCSHGAGRRFSRREAKRRFNLEDLAQQTEGVECKKDSSVLDEIPGAYKNMDAVMEAQSDVVEVVARLKAVLCVKG